MSRLFVSAGEPSGDLRAAELVRELRESSAVEIAAFGGNRLAEQGARIVEHLSDYAVMGFWEVISNLPRFFGLYRRLKREITGFEPDALLLVDYPGMNMKLARWAAGRGIRVIYYVSPQFWAWGKRRVRDVARYVTRMLTLFRFEKDFYLDHGASAVWVGHPLVDEVVPAQSNSGDTGEEVVLALLPGSRAQEVRNLLPPMLDAFRALRASGLVSGAVVAGCDTVPEEEYRTVSAEEAVEVVDSVAQALEGARAAVVCSGTATLETSLHGVPFVVVYRTSPLTYLVARTLVRGVRQIALANLVA